MLSPTPFLSLSLSLFSRNLYFLHLLLSILPFCLFCSLSPFCSCTLPCYFCSNIFICVNFLLSCSNLLFHAFLSLNFILVPTLPLCVSPPLSTSHSFSSICSLALPRSLFSSPSCCASLSLSIILFQSPLKILHFFLPNWTSRISFCFLSIPLSHSSSFSCSLKLSLSQPVS